MFQGSQDSRSGACRTIGVGMFGLLSMLPVAALAAGGSITGTVAATPAKYVEETVVYLKDAPATHAPSTVIMDQKGLRFIPHVLAVTVGDTVKFTNQDPVAHNVMCPEPDGYNLGTFETHKDGTHTFTKPGAYTQLCALHPEMLAFVFVGPNPFSATVDKDGHFTIKDVPPGTYKLAVWNSRLKGQDQSITVVAGKPTTANIAIQR